MAVENKTGLGMVRIEVGDITDMDIDAFVFYANTDLQLGTGFGAAIAIRAGASVQEELQKIGECATGEAVVTAAGKMKARHIIHAVGPKFQEEDTEGKLNATMKSALKAAEEKGIKQIAFPSMGTGFYGIPMDASARIMLGVLKEYLAGATKLESVVICVRDNRDVKPFQTMLDSLS